jgi:hypothetical protein
MPLTPPYYCGTEWPPAFCAVNLDHSGFFSPLDYLDGLVLIKLPAAPTPLLLEVTADHEVEVFHTLPFLLNAEAA